MVRFNYWVKDRFEVIVLADGEQREFREGGPTDEGYNYTRYRFTNEGDLVRLEIENTGSDCDGRLDTYAERVCPIKDLASYKTPDGTMVPSWVRVQDFQRDYTAEAAGY
jgi:hypothetical protein